MDVLTPTKELIQTEAQFETFYRQLKEQPLFALDTETNGKFNIFEVMMVGMSFGWENYGCYIPLNHLEGEQLPVEYVLDRIGPFLLDPKQEIIYHNRVFDEMVIGRYGIDIKAEGHDTMIMSHMYDENYYTKKLKLLVLDYLGYQMQTYEEIVEAVPRKRGEKIDYNFAKVPLTDALKYAADDALQTYNLFQWFKSQLKAEQVWGAYKYIEGPLQCVVRKMKERGVLIDMEAIRHADEVFPKIMDEIEVDIFREAGERFNVDSGQQLGPILFDKLHIGNKVKKTKTGHYSTDAKTLKLYQRHKIVEDVLRRKKIKKTHGTFVKGLEKFILQDGKVHCNFNSVGTDTGRFSSDKPNLQNQQGDEIEDIKIRDFFIPSPGYKLVIADYSQIELRLLAHFSGDENMTKAFTEAVRDFHDEAARKMLQIQGKPITYEEEVTARQRFHAKTLNFGIPYGRMENSVAEMLGCPGRCGHWPTWNHSKRIWEYINLESGEPGKQEAACHECGKCFIRDWYAAFPRIEPYKEHVLALTRQNGFVRTLSGRKRRLPLINSRDFGERTHAERQAFNTKIQGSAGDILKMAMVALQPKLDTLRSHILMTVHDELVMEAPEELAEEVVVIAKETMENPYNGKNPIKLPLVVAPSICERWSEGK